MGGLEDARPHDPASHSHGAVREAPMPLRVAESAMVPETPARAQRKRTPVKRKRRRSPAARKARRRRKDIPPSDLVTALVPSVDEPLRHAEDAAATGDEDDGDEDDGCFDSPRKIRRILGRIGSTLQLAIQVVVDENVVLSERLEHASKLWTGMKSNSDEEMGIFVRQRTACVVHLIEALGQVSYFPLQQLCFMSLATMLVRLQRRAPETIAMLKEKCQERLGSETARHLVEVLPFDEAINCEDPRAARHHLMQLNAHTRTCRSYRVMRCWASPNDKQNLARIRIEKWLDVGSTTSSFYWKDTTNIVVVNIPHSCIEEVEIDTSNNIMFLWTKDLHGLAGVRLLAFRTNEDALSGLVQEFAEESTSLATERVFSQPAKVDNEGEVDTVNESNETLDQSHEQNDCISGGDDLGEADQVDDCNGSNLAEMEEAESACDVDTIAISEIAESKPDVSFVDHRPELDEMYPEDLYAPTTVTISRIADPRRISPLIDRSLHSSDTASRKPALLTSTPDSLSAELTQSFDAVDRRLVSTSGAITDSFSRLSTSHLEHGRDITKKQYQVKALVDDLQQQRVLDVPHSEYVVDRTVANAKDVCSNYHEQFVHYVEEDFIDEEKSYFASVVALLLAVLSPWLAFVILRVVSTEEAANSYEAFIIDTAVAARHEVERFLGYL